MIVDVVVMSAVDSIVLPHSGIIIPLHNDHHVNSIPNWSIIELQGELSTRSEVNPNQWTKQFNSVELGDIKMKNNDKCDLMIGNQLLGMAYYRCIYNPIINANIDYIYVKHRIALYCAV